MAAAFHNCERKAYLLIQGAKSIGDNPYSAMMEETRRRCKKELEVLLRRRFPQTVQYEPALLKAGSFVMLNACIEHNLRHGSADALIPDNKKRTQATNTFEVIIASPRYKIVPSEKIRLAFESSVLASQRGTAPTLGFIFTLDGKIHRINLESQYLAVEKIAASIEAWKLDKSSDAPPVIINRHCSECRFQNTCRETAVGDENLTLLSGLTPKRQVQYQRKGIFTITQLSYQFRPRKSRVKRPKPTVHKPELQALALRTGKTYVGRVPEVIRSDTQIFLDIEGVSDRKFYYLAGLLVVSKGVATPYSFWANTPEDESKLWDEFLQVIQRHPDAPIFHYGQYDLRACEVLAQRSGGNLGDLSGRFVNVLSAIYGNIYFPTYGNGLKEIATHIGAQWPSELNSGLKSLVWRQRWEWSRDPELKKQLLEYNLKDCHGLRLITDRLSEIAKLLETDISLELADQPKKQATDVGEQLHQNFANILLLGHARYSEKRVAFIKKISNKSQEYTIPKRRRTNLLKPTRTVVVAPRRKCPNCKSPDIRIRGNQLGKAIVADLVFAKNGVKKSITLYVGPKVYCKRCDLMSRPKRVCDAYHGRKYGDGLIAYVAYQRVVLRLSLRTIASSINELFGLEIHAATSSFFTTQLALLHVPTEKRIMSHLLAAPCIHCDETKVNIEGENHYVWVMTDGEHVIFRSTETGMLPKNWSMSYESRGA